MKTFHNSSQKSGGFTLIEIMVVISIMAIVFGGGIAAYVNLNERQATFNVGESVRTMLVAAQKKARVGDVPAPQAGLVCDHLTGYTVGNNSPISIMLAANCQNNAQFIVNTVVVPTSISLISSPTIKFATLQGGVTGSGTFSLQSTNWVYSFVVDAGGSISDATMVKR